MNNKYLYDFHVHTSEGSKCASSSAIKQVDYYKSMGFDGIVITDHFFNGNTTVPNDIPWNDKVDLLSLGYKNAKIHGDECGLKVFFGWEYSYFGSDFLTYGLDIDWLKNNPNIMDMSVSEYCDYVINQGGMIFHAHPFREANYIEMIRLLPRNVNGVEVFNANRTDFENARAKEYAKCYNLLEIAGSDNHWSYQERLGAIRTSEECNSIDKLLSIIKNRDFTIEVINFK